MSVTFRHLALPLSLVAVLALAACGVSDPKNPRFVVAKGKGVEVTRGELDEAINQILSQRGMNISMLPPDRLPEIQKNIIDQLAIEKLLLNASKKVQLKDVDKKTEDKFKEITASVPTPELLKQQLEKRGLTLEKLKAEIRKQIILQETVESVVPEAKAPTEAEIEKFYNDNPARFNREAMVRASHVLVMIKPDAKPEEKAAKKKIAEAARARVAKGEAFAKVAQEVSEDKGSAQNGGDLDYFRKGMMVPEFEKVAFSAKTGEVSAVFETPFGFHFLVVTDTKPAGKIPLAEVHDRIASVMKNTQRSEALRAYVQKLKDDAKIKITLPEPPKAAPGAPASAVAPAAPAPVAAPVTAPAPAPAPAPAKK